MKLIQFINVDISRSIILARIIYLVCWFRLWNRLNSGIISTENWKIVVFRVILWGQQSNSEMKCLNHCKDIFSSMLLCVDFQYSMKKKGEFEMRNKMAIYLTTHNLIWIFMYEHGHISKSKNDIKNRCSSLNNW